MSPFMHISNICDVMHLLAFLGNLIWANVYILEQGGAAICWEHIQYEQRYVFEPLQQMAR